MTWLWTAWRWISGSKVGRAFASVLAALAVVWYAFAQGKARQREDRQAQDAKDYSDERQKIDDDVSGIGGSDRERIERLQSIHDRRGSGKD